jgi:hypothetical protein
LNISSHSLWPDEKSAGNLFKSPCVWCAIFSCCFSDFVFMVSFQHSYCSISELKPFALILLGSLSFLDVNISIFQQVWKVSNQYLFEQFFCLFLSPPL